MRRTVRGEGNWFKGKWIGWDSWEEAKGRGLRAEGRERAKNSPAEPEGGGIGQVGVVAVKFETGDDLWYILLGDGADGFQQTAKPATSSQGTVANKRRGCDACAILVFSVRQQAHSPPHP